jgi:hypothetical protein
MPINNENLNYVAAPSWKLMLQWIIDREFWRFGIGEDPNWGSRIIDQMVIKTAIFELADAIPEEALRRQIRTDIVKAMGANIEKMMKEAEK